MATGAGGGGAAAGSSLSLSMDRRSVFLGNITTAGCTAHRQAVSTCYAEDQVKCVTRLPVLQGAGACP